jgi:hypothetical protein
MRVLDRIRQAIREQRYRISSHGNEEMSDDTLESLDIENIILTGTVAQRFTRDPRGPRYEIVGTTIDGRRAYVVCRFLLSGMLLIITAYPEEEKE